jgi:hypothetical protein
MLPLFDMLAKASQGQGLEMLARQFSLSQAQAQAALEALLPAFSQGLKRNVSDPYGVAAFMNAMATGGHAKYFEDASRAFSPAGRSEGEDILSHLFGSPELTRAISAQAAQAAGLSQEVIRQMLPGLAAMIMGGLASQATGQFGGQGAPGNPLVEMMRQMMRQASAMTQPPPAPANPFENPFGKAMEAMFGRTAAESAKQPAANPFGDNPFMRMFDEMMRGGRAEEPVAPTNPSGRPRTTYDDLFGQMFETGRKQRDEYQRLIESLFEQFGRRP